MKVKFVILAAIRGLQRAKITHLADKCPQKKKETDRKRWARGVEGRRRDQYKTLEID